MEKATPRGAIDRLMQLSLLISSDLGRYEKESGLTAPRIHLLWQLGLGGPTTQQRLAAAMEVTPRNVTGLVDGLVASGHVTREPHPSDRRATLVTPTAAGLAVIKDNQDSYDDLARQLFGDLSARRLADFTAVLDVTIARFTALMEEVES
ncbi:MarR family transcriptional regulator [Nocardioides sp. LHD-245]|uniref:MarR family winged helix-turn-helix transcriptional regulator n=1 Tax=Nocardioides sp. LHD-245 TaxID=3051387 RepID=UPI0027E16821|nr:MarR family transcriptional regulator [Nocardioides sp. LHD-245]